MTQQVGNKALVETLKESANIIMGLNRSINYAIDWINEMDDSFTKENIRVKLAERATLKE